MNLSRVGIPLHIRPVSGAGRQASRQGHATTTLTILKPPRVDRLLLYVHANYSSLLMPLQIVLSVPFPNCAPVSHVCLSLWLTACHEQVAQADYVVTAAAAFGFVVLVVVSATAVYEQFVSLGCAGRGWFGLGCLLRWHFEPAM